MPAAYVTEVNQKIQSKTEALLSELPEYVRDYMIARRPNTTAKTRLAYLYDLKTFFVWMQSAVPHQTSMALRDISIEMLAQLTPRDVEEFFYFCQSETQIPNSEKTLARKFACLHSFFAYLVQRNFLHGNPCDKVMKPKIKKDERIIKLAPDEVVRFLNVIEFGSDQIPEKQRKYLENTRIRDLAIATLLLGTGIRVSECVGLDRKDLDFQNCKINITRKGQKRQFIAMGDEVTDALNRYLVVRNSLTPKTPDDADALFLSTQKKRITVQAVENMITKYAEFAGAKEHITPHKLRKTYGTTLYNETGDIYLVARALGHESVNTTKDHYIDANEESLLNARNKVKLRR